eukprot:SM000025S08380  [mRNA]  locus=s25:462014:464634:+ [translate_table: standard]
MRRGPKPLLDAVARARRWRGTRLLLGVLLATSAALVGATAWGFSRAWRGAPPQLLAAVPAPSSLAFADAGRRALLQASSSSEPPAAGPEAQPAGPGAAAAGPSGGRCEDVFEVPTAARCEHARGRCAGGAGLVNYAWLHFCFLAGSPALSVPLLAALVVLAFYLLAETAEEYFCPVVALLADLLRLGPSTAGVTLLAFGNGAPDVFSSLAAFAAGDTKVGFGAILSAGAFVTAFVVGCISVLVGPFEISRPAFLRDILFYIIGVVLLAALYSGRVVHLWHSAGMLLYYLLFVAYVVYSDYRNDVTKALMPQVVELIHRDGLSRRHSVESGVAWKHVTQEGGPSLPGDSKTGLSPLARLLSWQEDEGNTSTIDKVQMMLHLPFDIMRRVTIPAVEESCHGSIYAAANVTFCPLLLLYICNPVIPFDYPLVVFENSMGVVPLWSLVLLQSSGLGLAHFLSSKVGRPFEAGRKFSIVASFGMSVLWINLIARELLQLLSTIGLVLGISPAILGVTVLAWGNSVGDLVADVTIARAGQPTMAVAGCFAGPMFNMLLGLGLPMTLRSIAAYPRTYELDPHPNIPIAIGFLLTSLVGSLVVVACCGFQITKWWGWCLITIYIVFMGVSLMAKGQVQHGRVALKQLIGHLANRHS